MAKPGTGATKMMRRKLRYGIVDLGKILLIPGLHEPALEPRINNLEADKCPREALKWIDLTVPPKLGTSAFVRGDEDKSPIVNCGSTVWILARQSERAWLALLDAVEVVCGADEDLVVDGHRAGQGPAVELVDAEDLKRRARPSRPSSCPLR